MIWLVVMIDPSSTGYQSAGTSSIARPLAGPSFRQSSTGQKRVRLPGQIAYAPTGSTE
jgi:hypothetical protein